MLFKRKDQLPVDTSSTTPEAVTDAAILAERTECEEAMRIAHERTQQSAAYRNQCTADPVWRAEHSPAELTQLAVDADARIVAEGQAIVRLQDHERIYGTRAQLEQRIAAVQAEQDRQNQPAIHEQHMALTRHAPSKC